MSPIPMNILAYIAIITLLAFFGVIAWGVMTALGMVRKVKGTAALINPPRQAVLQIVSVGKGIGLRAAQRGRTMADNAKHAADSAMAVKDHIVTAVESLELHNVAAEARETAENVRDTGHHATSFFQQVMQIFNQAKAAQDPCV